MLSKFRLGVILLLAAGTGHSSGAAAPAGAAATPRVTSYARMTDALRADAAASPLITLASLGKSTRGKALWIARAADPDVSPASAVRVLFLCRQHGDEPASTEAVLGVLGRLAHGREPDLRERLKRTTFYFVPMVNPDGADANTRLNGAGADLNRDWGAFAQPETRAVKQAVDLLKPQVVVDAHNWDGDDPYNADCIEASRDRGDGIAGAAREAQADAVDTLAGAGFHVNATAYGPQADPRLAHRYFTAHGIVSMLVETHSGDPGDAGDFVRRQGVYAGLIHSLAHRFSEDGAQARLGALEGMDEADETRASAAARRLFPTPAHPAVIQARKGRAGRGTPLWLPAILAYAAALWALFQGRRSEAAVPARRRRFRRESRLLNVPGARADAVQAIRPEAFGWPAVRGAAYRPVKPKVVQIRAGG